MDLLKQCQKWIEEGKEQRVIEEIEAMPADERTPELDSELVHASQEWISEQYIADASQWGYIDPARWDGFYTWLTENNLIDGELLPGTHQNTDQ